MNIRPITPPELAELLALYHHLHAADDPLPAPEVVQAAWAELMAGPRHTCLGGYIDEVLMCACTLTIIPNLTRGCRPYALIENVVTHAKHRGRGHGKALLHAALARAWEAGCYKVMLLTGRKDEATLGFYEAAGFDRHGKQAFVAKPPV
ncbi:GNAT family N-acetyltransferase [Xylophilus sp. GW821-FHT01B05]